MKQLIVLLLLAAHSSSEAGDWPRVRFSSVRAYAWPNDYTTPKVILRGMALKPGVIKERGVLLAARQVSRLRAALTGRHSWFSRSPCYFPHNAFAFYNAARKPVAFVEVCFTCLAIRVSSNGVSRRFDIMALARLCDELKLPMGGYADLAAFKKDFASHSK